MALDTVGGDTLLVTGDYFGPVDATNIVNATYQNTELQGFAGMEFIALRCSVIEAHIRLSCVTVEGVGSGHAWTFVVGYQTSTVSLKSSYLPPVLTKVQPETDSGLFSTSGGEWALLHGFNFGPSFSSNTVNASYKNPALGHLGLALIGDTYLSPHCEVLSEFLIRCRSAEGLGYNQMWSVTVGGQSWPRAGNNASFLEAGVNATRVRTSYLPPVVTALVGPDGSVSGESQVLLSSKGGDKISLLGSNFGPVGLSVGLSVRYSNPFLADLAGVTYQPNCSVVVAHVQINCSTNAGVGFNQTWTMKLGNQSMDVSLSSTIITSYLPPKITSLESSAISTGIATDGSSTVAITGTNFGPIDPRNTVQAVYSGTGADGTLSAETHFVDCDVTVADTQLVCGTSPGVGFDLSWMVTVGSQNSVTSSDKTRYYSPSISTVLIVSGAKSLSTSGGDVINFHGVNFGPVGTTNYVLVSYKMPRNSYSSFGQGVLQGYSLETRELNMTDCSVTTAHTIITCSSVIGVGRGYLFTAVVGGQESAPSTTALSYTTAAITAVNATGYSKKLLGVGGCRIFNL